MRGEDTGNRFCRRICSRNGWRRLCLLFLKNVPGTFFFTGAKPENVSAPFPHHHPKFDINEKAMLTAAKTLGLVALRAAEL